MERAQRRDARRLARADDGLIPIGVAASTWACVKFAAIAASAPLWVPIVLGAAAWNHRQAKADLAAFPKVLNAIADREPLGIAAGVVIERPATERIVIFSDLHRCVAGRRDWPRRQSTLELYREVLEHYDGDGWTLCENGDVEDFWMVGGSALGAAYDAGRLIGGAVKRRDPSIWRTVHRTYLSMILDNNAALYRLIRDRFAANGRYVRTIGNHDDPLHHDEIRAVLCERVGEVPIGDFVALRHDNDALAAVIAHGHHTDAWNAPHEDLIGKFSTWFGNTIIDVPGLSLPEGLPPESASEHLLAAGPRDHLVELHPIIGATTDYDSLDEELLFEAIRAAGLSDQWLIFGHTHIPMDGPSSKSGARWRGYVNGGSAITDGLITGVEWDGARGDFRPRLVAWRRGTDGLERIELAKPSVHETS